MGQTRDHRHLRDAIALSEAARKHGNMPFGAVLVAPDGTVIAPAGSAVYFNPRVWHSGGKNETDRWRHSLTLNMCRGYMKQRLDIPKIMALSPVDLASADEKTLQKMGFYAQVPESLDEYYLPPEKRKFRQKAE